MGSLIHLCSPRRDQRVVHFYDDIYKHDAALEKGYPYPG